jgi:tRNA A-37 threonylcarbamoyl transferase component Bud32
MAVQVRCPGCGRSGSVSEVVLGRVVRCAHCRHRFAVPPSADASPADAGTAKATADEGATLDPEAPTMPPLEEQRRRELLLAATVNPYLPSPTPGREVPVAESPPRIGRFEVRALLGRGAFGTVFRAYDPQLDREVALKVLQAGALDSPTAVERFQREARAAGRLHHPRIVPVHEVGCDGPFHFIASALIAGRTLRQVIDEGGVEPAVAARVVGELARALDYAHRQGVIHRDVKAANVMLDQEGEPYLMDFGLACQQEMAARLTQEGAILGTPAYMAPEHAGGQTGPSQPAGDQYSLGVVLYELLCGRVPFSGPAAAVLYHAIHTTPPQPRAINPHVPPALELVCLRALSKRPGDRYSSCRAFADALAAWQQGPQAARKVDSPPTTVFSLIPQQVGAGLRGSAGVVRRAVAGAPSAVARLRRALPRPGAVLARLQEPRRLIVAAAVALVLLIALSIAAVAWLSKCLSRPEPIAGEQPPANQDERPPAPPAEPEQQGTNPKENGQKPVQGPGPEKSPPGGPPKAPARPNPPARDRRQVGQATLAAPVALVRRASATEPWQRVPNEGLVSTRDTLVSLPGYHSVVRLSSGVGVTLWGSTYEYRSPFLESAVILHTPSEGLDADFTLDRGAVLLTNHNEKKSAVRVRFHGEVWDVTLEDPGTEVGVGLLGRHVLPYDSGAPPRLDGFLLVRKGRASIRVSPFVEYGNLQPARQDQKTVPLVMFWDNQAREAQRPAPAPREGRLQALVSVFDPPAQPDTPKEVREVVEKTQAAVGRLSTRLDRPGTVDVTLTEILKLVKNPTVEDEPVAWLTVRCLGALDLVGDLVNLLDDDQASGTVRVEAITTLRHWTGRSDGHDALLYDHKTKSGALTAGGTFSPSASLLFMDLLHSPGKEQLDSADYWAYLINQLLHPKLAIRELAYFHLRRLVPEGQKIPYDPAGPPEARGAAHKQWKELIPDGKVPPRQDK